MSAFDAGRSILTNERAPLAWFHDPSGPGTWNMAVDEALLRYAMAGGPPLLRFYHWNQPTLSLGYFQHYEERRGHAASASCAVVRRATGGGAILHDRELTYSCFLPAGHPLARRSMDLYYAIHHSILAALADFGIAAYLMECPDLPSSPAGCAARRRETEPFLCFQRRTAGDVLLAGSKIAGSAQRRQRGAVLQHGSILAEASPFAPELPGIIDLATADFKLIDFVERLREAVSQRLECELVWRLPDDSVFEEAAAIEAAKFASEHWQRLR